MQRIHTIKIDKYERIANNITTVLPHAFCYYLHLLTALSRFIYNLFYSYFMTTSQKEMLVDKVQKYIIQHNLIQSDENILVGVSGGSDSIALLHILASLFPSPRLYAIYINHGLRPQEAEKEQKFIREVCQKYNVTYKASHIKTRDFAKKTGSSIEEAARILRYQQFAQRAKEQNCSKIAVAHTADDQVEHFFIRLLRGGGAKSLSGMRPAGKLPYHKDTILQNGKESLNQTPPTLIRPFLFLHKKELQGYLNRHNFLWCEDSSNSDPEFLRNRIRGELLPMIKNRFSPAINKQVLQVMDILQAENNYLENSSQKAYKRIVKEYLPKLIAIHCTEFTDEHIAIQRRIIEQCFWKMKAVPNFDHISKIIKIIKENKNGQEIHLAGGLRVYLEYDRLIFCYLLQQENKKRGTIKKNKPYSIDISKAEIDQIKKIEKNKFPFFYSFSMRFMPPKKENLQWQNKENKKNILYIDCDTISFPLKVRPMQEGDMLIPCNTNISKKIGRFFSEKKITVPQRTQWPLLVSDGKIIAVIGLQIADFCKVTTHTKTILVIEIIA